MTCPNLHLCFRFSGLVAVSLIIGWETIVLGEMFISGLGTAVPARRYTQGECWEALQRSGEFHRLKARSRAILGKVLTGGNGIVSRHLALERLEEAFDLSPDALNARFVEHAPKLATEAGERALADAGTGANTVDGLIISTCTGYLCPGLTSYVSERLALRPDVLAMDLVGQGCGAAVPNLRAAEGLLGAGRCDRVLSICVEVCSAAFFLDDDPGVLISACLFGDGAGAAVLTRWAEGQRRVEWKAAGSMLRPGARDLLRFEQSRGMLRNVLSAQVPTVAAEGARQVLERVLAGGGWDRSQIAAWVFHPGGRDVLAALRKELGLNGQELRHSEAALAEYGNLSSASVFFVLQATLADSAPGGYWWLSSFGAGFSCHGALLEVE